MARGAKGEGAAQPQPAVNWRVTLVSLDFFIDVSNLSREGGDLLQPLVFAAIVQANQAPLRHNPEIQRRYGDSGEAIPDELRRPISVNAVAQSLRLPFETVRRKTKALIEEGLCVATPAGVYVPQAAIVSARHAEVQAARLARLVRLHDDLADAGCVSPDQALPGPLPPSLMRSANRALSEYMLRTCDCAIELAGGVMDGFVLLGLCGAAADGALAATEDGATPSPKPCSMRAVARRLGLPQETVRRRLLALETRGFARRRGRRWAPALAKGHRDRVTRMVIENEGAVRRLLARLRELAQAQSPAQPAP